MADFSEIKAKVTIEEAAEFVGLQLRNTGAQLRGPCPACQTGGERALVITPSKGLFYCFSAGIGGDLLALVGHTEKCSLADAGRHIAANFGIGNKRTSAPVHTSATVPQAPQNSKGTARTQRDQPFDPAAFAAKLTYTDEVAALGFSEEDAAKFSIGFHRGRVYIPVRHADGSIAGFIGYADGELKLPSKWLEPTSNVVALPRRTA